MALTCLLDTSVWNRLDRAPALAAEVTTLLHHGEVGYSDIEDIERLEVLRSARHTDHYRRLSAMFAALPKIALPEAALMRAGHDYDLIASITGQDVAWVVDKGLVS